MLGVNGSWHYTLKWASEKNVSQVVYTEEKIEKSRAFVNSFSSHDTQDSISKRQ